MSEQQGQVQQQAGTGNTPVDANTSQTTGQPAPQQTSQQEPEWLSGRLARAEESARKKLLAELGVEEPETVKKLLEADKERKESEKGFEQRFKDEQTAHKTLKAQYDTLREAFNGYLTTEIGAIPKEYQEAAERLLSKVGDDPVLRLGVLQDLKPLFVQTQPEKRKPEDIDAGAGTEKKKVGSMSEDEIRKTFKLPGRR